MINAYILSVKYGYTQRAIHDTVAIIIFWLLPYTNHQVQIAQVNI